MYSVNNWPPISTRTRSVCAVSFTAYAGSTRVEVHPASTTTTMDARGRKRALTGLTFDHVWPAGKFKFAVILKQSTAPIPAISKQDCGPCDVALDGTMELSQLTARAMEIQQRFAENAQRHGRRPWTREEVMQGFVGDVGDLMKLVMAEAG